jgi:serine/threonine protein kinase
MARDLSTLDADQDGYFQLTPMTGSLRYMAPEVALGEPYDEGCDVHSFTIVFWFMLAIERPFKNCRDQDSFFAHVFVQGLRPAIKRKWSETCKSLLKLGWEANKQHRCDMESVKAQLHRELCRLRGDAELLLSDDSLRRRSTYVFEKGRLTTCSEPRGSSKTL